MQHGHSGNTIVMTIPRLVMLNLSTGAAALMLPLCGRATAAENSQPSVHQSGRIRVFYEKDGPDAVDLTDVNGNAIPDQVEDALTQLRAAEMLYVGALGYPDPFLSERYRHVTFLDVRFRSKETLTGNGKALPGFLWE